MLTHAFKKNCCYYIDSERFTESITVSTKMDWNCFDTAIEYLTEQINNLDEQNKYSLHKMYKLLEEMPRRIINQINTNKLALVDDAIEKNKWYCVAALIKYGIKAVKHEVIYFSPAEISLSEEVSVNINEETEKITRMYYLRYR